MRVNRCIYPSLTAIWTFCLWRGLVCGLLFGYYFFGVHFGSIPFEDATIIICAPYKALISRLFLGRNEHCLMQASSNESDRNHRSDRDPRAQRRPSGIPPQFPKVLHSMLSCADRDGYSHIVSWLPHGRSFVVRDRERFVQDVMPRFFKQTKFASFQRQLNLYGFRRIEKKGPDHKSYFHKDFLRESPQLLESMARTHFRGSPVSATSLILPQTAYPLATQQLPMLPTRTKPQPPAAAEAAAASSPYGLGNTTFNQNQNTLEHAQFLFLQGNAFPNQNPTLDPLAYAQLLQQYMLLVETTRQAMSSHQQSINTSAQIPNQMAQLNSEQPNQAINMAQHQSKQTHDTNPQLTQQMSRLKEAPLPLPPPPQEPTQPPLMEPRDRQTEPESMMNEGEISNMAAFLEDVDLDTSGETSKSQESP